MKENGGIPISFAAPIFWLSKVLIRVDKLEKCYQNNTQMCVNV